MSSSSPGSRRPVRRAKDAPAPAPDAQAPGLDRVRDEVRFEIERILGVKDVPRPPRAARKP